MPSLHGDVEGVFDRANHSLVPEWQAVLQSLVKELKPYFANGTIVGVFFGDELCCSGIPFSNLSAVVKETRALLDAAGETDALLCEWMSLLCPIAGTCNNTVCQCSGVCCHPQG